jgi:predicted nucleic acid-binding protein
MIIDANIIFSAAIKPSGVIGSIVFSQTAVMFMAPTYLKEEIEEHKQRIILITKKTEDEIDFVLMSLFERINFYPVGVVSSEVLEKAKEIVKDIDPDDSIYVAFALFFHTKIWSGDKVLAEGLKRKGYDLTLTTQDVAIAIMK